MRLVFLGVLITCACAGPPEDPQGPAPSEQDGPTTLDSERSAPEGLDGSELENPAFESAEETDLFFGLPDAPALEALQNEEIVHVRCGRGGRSLAFKITLSDGTEGYFKPEQSFSGAHWYSEIAAYHLDRMLGFGRTAPVTGRTIPWRLLDYAAKDHPRRDEAIIDDEDMVRGAFIWWIPGSLAPWQLGQDWEHFVRVRGGLEITPFQRPVDYRNRINGDAMREETEIGSFPDAAELMSDEESAQLSDLIVFDYLISNVDRWGGEYTNVRRRGFEQLVFLDNGAGFWETAHLGLMEARLSALQRFRTKTRERLAEFHIDDFEARLAADPLAPVLPEYQLEALAERIDRAIAHIDETVERFGADVVLIDSRPGQSPATP